MTNTTPTPGALDLDIDAERREFEASMPPAYPRDRNMPDKSYNSPHLHERWQGWLACALARRAAQPSAEEVAEGKLAKAIADAAIKLGICRPDAVLTGPQLLMLVDDLAFAASRRAGGEVEPIDCPECVAHWNRITTPAPESAAQAGQVACSHAWNDFGQLGGRNVSWCPRCDTLAWTGKEPGPIATERAAAPADKPTNK